MKQGTQKDGQGLLEAIIALGILMTGVVAVLTLALASLRAGVTSESRIVAANLAREGVEFIRNVRDSNWVKAGGTAWDAGLADGTYVLRWDQVENQLTLQEASLGPEAFRLYRSDTTGIIAAGVSLGTKTPFFRSIVLSHDCTISNTPSCIRVLSRVEWEERGRSARPHLDVVTELYQWR